MFQPVLDTISLTCRFLLNSLTPAQFTVYCHDDGTAWDGEHMATKAEDVADAIVAGYLPALSQDHDFVGVTARDLAIQFGRVVEFPVAAAAGAVAFPTLPGNVSPRVKFQSEFGAPRTGGIKFMPPAESQVTGDVLTGAAVIALQAAADALHVAIGAGVGEEHVILSRHEGMHNVDGPNETVRRVPTLRAEGLVNSVQTVVVNPLVGSQRSRLIA